MPETQALSAQGVILERDGNPIAELTKIGGIEITLETIDVTTLTSPDDFREHIGTLFEGGDVSIEGNFIPGDTDGQIALMADQLAKTKQSFVTTFPPALIVATWSFSALVTKLKVGDFPTAGKIDFSATLKISGKPILAIGATVGPSALVITGNVSGPLTLTPVYDAGDYDYVADGTGDASVTVTVTADGAITVNGSAVESEVPSSAITLTENEITTITVVVTDTGKVAKTYIFRIMGAAGA
jgi:hypothetical protein